MTTDYKKISSQIATGAGWTVLMRFGVRFIGVISTIVLARVLVPADFGLVALAMLLVTAVEVMAEFNFEVYLIRDQKAGREIYDTVWSLTIIRGAVMGLLMIALAGPASVFFNEPRIEQIVYLLAAITFLESLQNVGIVDFRKHMQFDRDFVFMLSAKIIAFTVTIGLALWLRSYWALVIGTMSERIVRILLSYRMHPFRPRWSLAGWHEILSFSSWLLFNNFLNFIYTRSDTFFIGKIVGTTSVGLYSVAYEISNLATTEIVAPIRRAIFPGYAKMADDPELMRQGYLDVLSVTLMVTAPVAAGIGLIADPFVRVILGEKWLAAIPLIQILAIYGLVSIAWSNTAPLFLALGRPKVVTLFLGIGVIVILPSLYYGVSEAGALGGALAITFSNFVILLVAVFQVVISLNLSLVQLARAIWRPLFGIAAMAFLVTLLHRSLPADVSFLASLWKLILLSAVGAVVYVTATLGAWRLSGRPDGPEQQVLGLLLKGWSKVRRASAENQD
tara:strand:- start:1874 stop:3388 length:1515 start_codon:yes stop_codon:yes gene_type:complete